MSRYTTTVRAICEATAGLADSAGYDDVDEILDKCWNKIFAVFPIYDESHRNILCKKILRHYYMDEIAFETVGLWKLEVNTRLNEIMPKYNELYAISAKILNPLYNKEIKRETVGNTQANSNSKRTDDLRDTHSGDVKYSHNDTRTDNLTDTNGGTVTVATDNTRTDDLTTTTSADGTTTVTSTAKTTSNVDTYGSDTPQGSLTDVKAGKYMTNANISDSTTNTTGNDSTTNKNTGTTKNTGTQKNKGTDTTTDSHTLTKTGTVTNKSNDTTTDTSAVAHTGTVTDTATNVTDNTVTEIINGYEGSDTQGELLSKYSNSIINIDMMIINELSDMFMQIW